MQPLRKTECRDTVHNAEVGCLRYSPLSFRNILYVDTEYLGCCHRMHILSVAEGSDQMLVAAQMCHNPQFYL